MAIADKDDVVQNEGKPTHIRIFFDPADPEDFGYAVDRGDGTCQIINAPRTDQLNIDDVVRIEEDDNGIRYAGDLVLRNYKCKTRFEYPEGNDNYNRLKSALRSVKCDCQGPEPGVAIVAHPPTPWNIRKDLVDFEDLPKVAGVAITNLQYLIEPD